MTGLSTQDLFNGLNSFSISDNDYHSISTDNQYMAELGLSVFTLSQFMQWMFYTNSFRSFVNLKFIDGIDYSPVGRDETLEERFLSDNKAGDFIWKPGLSNDNDWMSFSKWEKRGRTGEFIKTRYNEWFYGEYSFSDINVNVNFKDKEIRLIKQPSIYDATYSIQFVDKKQPDSVISTIVAMNDLARFLPLLRDFNIPNALPRHWIAAYEFIMDIKSSKEKCIQWSATIPFVAWVGTQKCVKNERVNFKLHLFDFTNPKDSNRTAALNNDNLFISLPRQDPFGRLSLNDGTGDLASPDPANISSRTNAQLALSMNPSDGKAYSGSPTVLVRLADTLPAAEWTSAKDTDDIEDEYRPDTAHAPGLGFGIPVAEQNANPLQWASQYSQSKCVNPERKRFVIPLQNHHPTNYPSGAMGYATKIMGQTFWSFIPIGSYEIPEIEVDNRPKNWSFMYLMMNYDNFFAVRPRITNLGYDRITYTNTAYEQEVRKLYYNIPPVNDSRRMLDLLPALQITSWDFMGTSIGGLRLNENNNSIGNALSVTLYGFNNDGTPWQEDDFEFGKSSCPFFGCVFPDGYTTEKYDEYTTTLTRNLLVKHPETNTSRLDLTKGFIRPVPALGTTVFVNQSDATNRGSLNQGMFYPDGSMSRTLNHLPADIALNSAPDNDSSGSPLVNYYSIYSALRGQGVSSNVYQAKLNNIIGENYNNKNTWLYRDPNPSDSAFGFKPINPYKIQFRPLKHEIYDCFYPLNSTPNAIFSKNAASRQTSILPPLNVNYVRTRSGWFTQTWDDGLNGMLDSLTNSLRYNSTLLNSRFLPNEARCAQVLGIPGYSSSRFDFIKNKNAGTGAFGIIGSSCVINLSKSIKFNTSFRIGMRSYPTVANRWRTSYGNAAKDNSYKSLNNTQLWVRIYQHWPKEYTIYDPSNFAIFHFNTEDPALDILYYRINNLDPLRENDLVYADYINNNQVLLQELKDPIRRKKLLPFKYHIQGVIGIDLSSIYFVENTLLNLLLGSPTPANFSVVIDKQGSGYTADDTFKVTGGDGISPVLKAIVDNGKIIGFNYADQEHKGYNYKQSNFLKKNDNFLTNPGGLRIVAITAKGRGFQGRIVRGMGTVSPTLTDEGPLAIGPTLIQLTENTPIVDVETTSVVEPLTGSKEITIEIEQAKKSKDGLYDLFFHFHNDTSHTFIDNYGLTQNPLEQFVEVEIIPN